MKKAVVVGGANGIGLAIAINLIKKGKYVLIVDKNEPDKEALSAYNNYQYISTDLRKYDYTLFEQIALDDDVKYLIITAGFGRVALFENLHSVEIENLFKVNTISVIETIKTFYNRINSKEDFYCGVMGSIAGLMSSPLFSCYAASKAALCRFIESVNIELEKNEVKNRILNVSPASIQGTKFNGGENNLTILESLSDTIIDKMNNREVLFIPQYEEKFKEILDNYIADPHAYGIHSYEYKMNGGRVSTKTPIIIGYLSGTFDLFHIGHLNLLKRAKENCDYLIVGVHANGSHKKKDTFIPFEERKAIVESCKYVDKVVDSTYEDSDAVFAYGASRLFVGSDYKGTERFNRYEEIFKDKDIEIVYFPYTQGTSSTQLRDAIEAK